MSKYFRASGGEIVQVGIDVVLGDGLLALVDAGIDEGTHFWNSAWDDINDDDFDVAINDPAAQARMIEYVRLPLIEKMREVLQMRREKQERHGKDRG